MSSTSTSLGPKIARRQYRVPPVQEAVVAIHVEPGQAAISVLRELHAGEEEQYPVRESVMTGALRVDPGTSQVVQAEQVLDGYRMSTSDRSRVAQFRQNQFVFSRLAPYNGWDAWRVEAQRLWQRYRAVAEVATVTELGVRYVNRIDIRPEPGRRIRDYLKIYPQIPEDFPQALGSFVMRVEMKVPELPNATLAVNVGRVDSPGQGIYSVLLDIDVRMTTSLTDEAAIWDAVEQLHMAENRYFETCITDHSRRMFE